MEWDHPSSVVMHLYHWPVNGLFPFNVHFLTDDVMNGCEPEAGIFAKTGFCLCATSVSWLLCLLSYMPVNLGFVACPSSCGVCPGRCGVTQSHEKAELGFPGEHRAHRTPKYATWMGQ